MAADNFEMRYKCTSVDQKETVKYLLFNDSIIDNERIEQVTLASEEEITNISYQKDLIFTIKVREEEQFITLKNFN